MYKLTMKNIVDFTKWWNKQNKKRDPTEADASKYFNLPIFK